MQKLKLDELNRLSLDEMESASRVPIVVVLDNIRSAYNVGSVFRTSDAFRIEHIYLCGITATPPHKEIFKTAIGSTKTIAWTHFANINECILHLKKQGYYIIAIEQTTESIPLDDFSIEDIDLPVAIVMGNEVDGVSEEILENIDIAIEIPQYGTKHSLNVSVCAGIVLYDLSRKLLPSIQVESKS